MKINFAVGKKEKHQVEFFFDQFLGNINFKVDGQIVKKHFVMFSFSLTKRFNLTVGNKEKHEVEVEMKRPLLLAGFRKSGWLFTVRVDGKMVKEVS